jgi:hypothetical protein
MPLFLGTVDAAEGFRHGTPATPRWEKGTGDPEGVVAAPIGSLYSRIDGGTDTTIYRKETGTGNTGWVATSAGGGTPGPPGPPGISQGQYLYKWQTDTTAADPGHGRIKGNSTDSMTITTLYVSAYNDAGQVVIELSRLATDDFLYLYRLAVFDTWNRYDITGDPINHGNDWFEIPVVFADTGSLPFQPNNNVEVDLVLPVSGEPGPPGPPGVGVPVGGDPGQILGKASGTDYDTEWTTPAPSGVASVDGRSGTVTLSDLYVDVTGDNITGSLGLGVPVPTAKLQFAQANNAAGGILFGTDTNLYRAGADHLRTDDSLTVTGTLNVNTALTAPILTGTQNTTSVNAFAAGTALSAKQLNAAANNWTEISLLSSTGIVGGIAAKHIDQANRFADIYVHGRSTLGFYPRLRIPSAGGLDIYNDANFVVTSLSNTGGITFGTTADTNLYRSGINTLKTDDSLHVVKTLGVGVTPNPDQIIYASAAYNTGGTVVGVASTPSNSGSGSVNGVWGGAFSTGTGGSVYDLTGVQGDIWFQDATGTLTGGSALRAKTPTITAGGVITNAYGVYVENQKVAGATYGWGIYQFGSSDLNYFAGRVGIGGIVANGLLTVGANTTTPAGGIWFGTDTTMYRSAGNTLTTGNVNLNQNELQNAVTHKLALSPASPVEGQRYYDTTLKVERYYDGIGWVTPGAGGVTSVDGLTGAVTLANKYVDVTGDTMTGPLVVRTPTTADITAELLVASTAVGRKPVVVQGIAGQTANLLEVQSSTGAVLASVSNAGTIGVVAAADPNRLLQMVGTVPGTASGVYGAVIIPTAKATVSLELTAAYLRLGTVAATFNVPTGRNIHILSPNLGVGSTMTSAFGLDIEAQKGTGVTNGYGIYQRGASDLNVFGGTVQCTNPASLTATGQITFADAVIDKIQWYSGYRTGIASNTLYHDVPVGANVHEFRVGGVFKARVDTNGIDLNQNQLRNAVTHKLATPPAAPVEGQRYYDTTMKTERYYDGAKWITPTEVWIGTGAPTGTSATGDLWFDTDESGLGFTLPVSVAQGGTGATNAAAARTGLAVPGIPVLVTEGGTGATTAAAARTGLAVPAIGNSTVTAGAPTTGTWARGDQWLDSVNVLWTCITAGTPGTWKPAAGREVFFQSAPSAIINGGGTTYAGTLQPVLPIPGSLIVNAVICMYRYSGAANGNTYSVFAQAAGGPAPIAGHTSIEEVQAISNGWQTFTITGAYGPQPAGMCNIGITITNYASAQVAFQTICGSVRIQP